ncbi:unnamed protein product [Haemonchus placei]|uniref:Uncharacterized protein n=1 Tax=Haemonchus placei TaxID=6290 RepID=A0A3P7WCC9_HAEPC|nr:unnamed protein product [Haemonchus placei]
MNGFIIRVPFAKTVALADSGRAGLLSAVTNPEHRGFFSPSWQYLINSSTPAFLTRFQVTTSCGKKILRRPPI